VVDATPPVDARLANPSPTTRVVVAPCTLAARRAHSITRCIVRIAIAQSRPSMPSTPHTRCVFAQLINRSVMNAMETNRAQGNSPSRRECIRTRASGPSYTVSREPFARRRRAGVVGVAHCGRVSPRVTLFVRLVT